MLSRARKIAAGAAEFGRVLAGDHPYPPGEPVPLSRAAGLAEIPAAFRPRRGAKAPAYVKSVYTGLTPA